MMTISRPAAEPWGDPTEAARSLVRQLATAEEPDPGEGAGGAAGLEPEQAQVVRPIAARMAIRNGFIFADPFRSSGTAVVGVPAALGPAGTLREPLGGSPRFRRTAN